MVPYSDHYVVGREAGPGTVSGEGDTLIDNYGNRYRVVSPGEADMIRNSTGGQVYSVDSSGLIR